MALRLLLSLKSKHLSPKVIWHLPQKFKFSTFKENENLHTFTELKEDKSDEYRKSKEYFRSIFYETHPTLKEGNVEKHIAIEKEPDHLGRHNSDVTLNADSQMAPHESRLKDDIITSEVANNNISASQNTSTKHVFSSSFDPNIVDSVGTLLPKEPKTGTENTMNKFNVDSLTNTFGGSISNEVTRLQPSSNRSTDPWPADVFSSSLDPEVLDTIGPPLPKSFNLAAFVDKSETLQQLVKLGVNLFFVERAGYGQYFLDLDFERDVKNHLVFFNDVGISAENMGTYISRNPVIFKEDLDDLKTRIEYLKSKKFRKDAIARIVTVAPAWLSHTTKQIDSRLGFVQKQYRLSGNEVRFLITKKPKIALTNFHRLRESHFLIEQQLGFTKEESKKLLLEKPKLFLINKKNLWERFDFLHNELKIPHKLILLEPSALLQRKFKVQEKHLYLQKLRRAQYDPTKEGYVSLRALILAKEDEFCNDICKTSIDDFNNFLKTL